MLKQWNIYLQLLLFFHCCDINSADSQWPDGKYGLPKPNAGCPNTADVTWESGWILQDMVKEYGYFHSKSFHLKSDLTDDIKRYFCMKTKSNSTGAILWPPGRYCIYRGRGETCPAHMRTGFYSWDDEDRRNRNSQYGAYPDGVYDSNTLIRFCCSIDGDRTVPISLPTNKPFFLLAQGSDECQQVKWALATAESLTYDTERPGQRGGIYPYNGWLQKNPTIYYCYYQNCNYTLSKDSGPVTSPNYPDRVPRGQFCSWRITATPGHQVNLKFKTFSLSGNENDQVEVFDGDSDTAPTLGVFTGNNAPPPLGVNSSSNTMFIILRSTSKPVTGTNRGNFRAIFSKREPPAIQTSTKALTTLQVTTNSTFTKATREPTNSPIQSSGTPEHVTTEVTEAMSTEHAVRNDSAQGGAGTVGMVAVAVVVPLVMVMVLAAGTAFFLCKKRKKDKQRRKEVLSVVFNSTPQDSAAAVDNPIYDTEIHVDRCGFNHGNEDDYTYVERDVIQSRISQSIPEPSCEERESDNPLYDTAETDHDDEQLHQRHEITCKASPRLSSTNKNDGDLQPVEQFSRDKASEYQLYDATEPSCLANPIYQCTN